MKATTAKLRCFLSNHDLVVYPGYSLRLECRRCHDPWSDTLRDKWERWKRQRKLPKVERSDELPF
jgi:hypothetical protein